MELKFHYRVYNSLSLDHALSPAHAEWCALDTKKKTVFRPAGWHAWFFTPGTKLPFRGKEYMELQGLGLHVFLECVIQPRGKNSWRLLALMSVGNSLFKD